ncbi:phosphotransferase [Tepidibacillus sp. HK-1]|uniref:phosphotransferase n=1 Tax=Tepidibacillus sp. HK-1 TaxID=1883407 RepID=UPI0008532056|nr:phosphotransferase [Tepidibacillus sp. HK-1]GBF10015.1 spore coat protein I [Tepidibacillus sp. HK-1]
MEEWLSQELINNYGIEPTQIKSFYHLWQVESNQGTWIIKAYPKQAILIHWLYDMTQALKRKGFAHFSQIVANRYQIPWFGTFEHPFMVMEYVEGRHADYHCLEDLSLVLNVLAEFHHHGSWIQTKAQPKKRSTIQEKWMDRLNEFKQLYQNLLFKTNLDPFEQQIITLGPDMIHFAERALETLDGQWINRLQQEAIDNRMLAHRDVASHNFLIGEKTSMIDFDLAGYEVQILDVWQLFNRAMVEWKWDLNIFQQMEEQYQQNHKLRDQEKKLIHQLSLYPNEFFRESLGVYKRPEKYRRKNVSKMMNHYMEEWDRFTQYQKEIVRI